MLARLAHIGTGLLLVSGMLALWAAALFVVVWGCFYLCSRFAPLIGRRHKHRKWKDLNPSDRAALR